MADGPFRHYGAGSGQQYFFQQPHPKHLARTGSPVSATRNLYSTDTPSPSRSPPLNNSHQFNMFGQSQSNMLNGANGHTRFIMNNQHKQFGHQTHQHHNQQNHHHQQNHSGHPGHGNIGHQHTFSGGMNLGSSQEYGGSSQNEELSNDHLEMNSDYPEHWQKQLQLIADVRTNAHANHRHSRKHGAQPAIKANTQTQNDDSQQEGDAPERNRLVAAVTTPAQDWDGLDMSGQGLRVLSRTLTHSYSFLVKLYVDNNKLVQLPEEIGTLRNLIHLQASNNLLRMLPRSIGMLSKLQELLVYDNRIDTLPTEIGYLSKLECLGIEGNPIHSDTREFLMQNGTKTYVTHLRDNTEPGAPPRPRQTITLDDSEATDTFTVLDWNILCDKYVSRSHYPTVPTKALEWEYRRELIIEEIKSRDADILCLQEIDAESYEEFFRRELAYYHYKGIFWQKSRARTMTQREAKLVDGCAIFYKSQKYILLDKHFIDFANIAINRPDMKGEHDIFNRVMPRDHVAVAAFLENRMTGSRMIVANAHIFWDPGFTDVKVVQVAILMDSLTTQAEKWAKLPPKTDKAVFRHTEQDAETETERADTIQGEPAPSMEYSSGTQIPIIACGDFNVSKRDGIFDLLSRGTLPADHPDISGRSYGNLTREGMSHPFKLKSVYNGEHRDYIEFTNYTPDFQGLIDYIWYSTSLQLRNVLGDVDFDYIQKVPGFPTYHFPSDHLPIMAEFAVLPRKERKVVEANFGPQRDRRA